MLPKKAFIVLPCLVSKIVTQQLKHVFTSSMAVSILRLFSAATLAEFFTYKDRFSGRSFKSKVAYKASCKDCDNCYIENKTSIYYMTGKRNISKRSRVTAILLPMLIMI